MTVSYTWAIELKLSGSWTDVTRDVIKRGKQISLGGGLKGQLPTDCVAGIGTLSFYLDNSEANSAGLLGYYSPEHANCRAGFLKDVTEARIKFVYGATTKYFLHSWVNIIEPASGQFRERVTYVQAVNYIQKLTKAKTLRIPVQQNKRFDQLIDTVVSNCPTSPLNTSYAVDPSTSILAMHLERDEKSTLINVIQKICQSTGGKFYIRGNATDGETLVYENRNSRSLVALSGTLDNTMSDMKVSWKAEKTYDAIKATINPYDVDVSEVVLFSLQGEISVRAGQTYSFDARLRDPAGNTRVSGMDFIDPLVADTDYKITAYSGSSNNDLNGSVTITLAEKGSNTVKVQIVNPTGVTAYINFLQLRGKGIYPYDVIDFNFGSGDSVLNYSMPYMNNFATARAIAQSMYTRIVQDKPDVSGVKFYPDANATLMNYFMTLDIGSRIALIEEATGLNSEFFINGYDVTINDGLLEVFWTVADATLDGGLFILDDATKGVLDNTTYVLAV